MTKEEIEALPDDKLYQLSLMPGTKTRYSRDATIAYMERQRRAGYVFIDGAGRRCRPLRNDVDYFGSSNISNR